MANNITTISEGLSYTAQKLLSVLRNELALLGFTARNFENEVAQNGQTVNINDLMISGAAKTRTIGGAVDIDDATSVQQSVTLKQIYKGVKADNLQKTFSNVDLMDALAQRLGIILADGADAELVNLHLKMPYECGEVDGTAAFNSTDKLTVLAKARQILTLNKVPFRDMKAVLGPIEAYNLRALPEYHDASKAGGAEQLRTGNLGQIYGFDTRESQATPSTVTVSTAAEWGTTPNVNKVGGYPIGTTEIIIEAAGAGTIKAGSTFLLGNYRYAVIENATVTANAATLKIFPALKEAVIDDQVLTKTAHSAAGSIGYAYHPDAFLQIVRPLAPFTPGSGVVSVIKTDEVSGLSVRLSIQSKLAGAAGTAMQEEVVADFLAGFGLIRPEMAVKIYGSVT